MAFNDSAGHVAMLDLAPICLMVCNNTSSGVRTVEQISLKMYYYPTCTTVKHHSTSSGVYTVEQISLKMYDYPTCTTVQHHSTFWILEEKPHQFYKLFL